MFECVWVALSGRFLPRLARSAVTLAEPGIVDAYFSCVEIDENVVLSLVPTPLTVVMITTAMPAALRPCSIAVAAVSSFRNSLSLRT